MRAAGSCVDAPLLSSPTRSTVLPRPAPLERASYLAQLSPNELPFSPYTYPLPEHQILKEQTSARGRIARRRASPSSPAHLMVPLRPAPSKRTYHQFRQLHATRTLEFEEWRGSSARGWIARRSHPPPQLIWQFHFAQLLSNELTVRLHLPSTRRPNLKEQRKIGWARRVRAKIHLSLLPSSLDGPTSPSSPRTSFPLGHTPTYYPNADF